MADHKATTILAAVVSAVTGLATTGANVFAGRSPTRAMPSGSTPALTVYMGSEISQAAPTQQFRDCRMEVIISAHVRATESAIDPLINQIHKEVVIALLASIQLGLSYVFQIRETSKGRPEIDSSTDTPTARCEFGFEVDYRRSYSDPSS